jgi:hypothetical protein
MSRKTGSGPDPQDFNFLTSEAVAGSVPQFEAAGLDPATADETAPGETEDRVPESRTTESSYSQSSEVNPAAVDTIPRPQPAMTTSQRLQRWLPAYAVAVTLLLLGLLLTGRISLSGNHALESLPDIRPLAPNEFRKVPDDVPLPAGHVMRLGESRRFGDVVVTPKRIERRPLTFEHFQTREPRAELTTQEVWLLRLEFRNAAEDCAFPPFDAGLMSHRSPRDGTDDATLANSFLLTTDATGTSQRVLNFLHSPDSNFVLTGQNSGHVLQPGEAITTFVACQPGAVEPPAAPGTEWTWRVQFRKGVHRASGNGVTTLIDVVFDPATAG